MYEFSDEMRNKNKELYDKLVKAKERISQSFDLHAIKMIESIDINEVKEFDKLDYAKFLNLRGVIFYENGYISKALSNFNLAAINFKELSQDPYDPFIINNKFDEILGTSFFCNNLFETKNEIFELISMSQLLNNDFLIIKGFFILSSFYCNIGDFRYGFGLTKYTWDLAKKKKFHSDFIMNRLVYLYTLYIHINRNTILKDEIFSKINTENNDIVKNKLKELSFNLEISKKLTINNKSEHDSNPNTKEKSNDNGIEDTNKESSLFQNPLHVSQVFYCISDTFLKKRELYKSLFFIEKAIEHLEKNNYIEIHLVFYYIKKWSILNEMGRESIAEHLIGQTQKLINKMYGSDSMKNLEYLRYLQITSSHVNPPRLDIIDEIIKKTKRVNDVDNVNSFKTKFYNICSLAIANGNYVEIKEIYDEFKRLEKMIFENKISEMGADIKTNFAFLKLKNF